MDGGPWKATVHGVAELDMTEQHLLTYLLTYCINLLSELSAFGFSFLPSLLLSCFQTILGCIRSDQIRSVAQSCPTLCDPINRSMPSLPVQHQLPEFTQTHVHRVSDVIQPSHPLSSPSVLAPNPSQHQGLFQ